MYHIVINPAAGHGKAPEFVTEKVVPLLDKLGLQHTAYTTQAPKDAGRIGQEILASHDSYSSSEPIKIIVAGGDGTAHELIEGVVELPSKSENVKTTWQLIILPMGTANALHASLSSKIPDDLPKDLEAELPSDPDSRNALSSLISSLSPSSVPTPLPITLTTITDSNSEPTAESLVPSHIVLSTSLHAALLHTSDELRTEYPGLERFKVAAQRNLGVFFDAEVKLTAPSESTVQQYDPKTKTFVSPYTTDGTNTLKGPFTYFLSTTICDRLEPTFVINPTLKSLPSHSETSSMDIVILRPLRDPHVRAARDVDEQQERWKKRAIEVIGYAYKGGGHVDLTYPDDGRETELDGQGAVVVETFRAGGFEWKPTNGAHTPSHLICADGSIHTIPEGGHARVEVAHEASGNVFSVWA